MDSQQFVDAIKEVVINDSVKSVQDTLIMPTGKSPSENSMILSKWYNSLNDSDKSKVLAVIKETAETSVFGFLCVLDGVRAVESTREKGVLSLTYLKDDKLVILNDPQNDYLHDLL